MEKKTSRFSYRFWEMVPGILAWTAILFPIWGSYLIPKAVAYLVLAFLSYWLYQSFKSTFFAIKGYFKIKQAEMTEWSKKYSELEEKGKFDFDQVKHVVIVSSYKEPNEVIDMVVGSLSRQIDVNLRNIFVVLGQEERAGKENNQQTINYFSKKYKGIFGGLMFTEHPKDIEGEIAGKHTNEAWAAKQFKNKYIASGKMDINKLTLTSCDVDTIFNKRYFSALTYKFGSDPERYVRFWQSPIFWHHNIDKVPGMIRVIGVVGNVLHIANIQEPDGLFFNYSCYSSSYRLIDESGYWDPDMIPEDWHIFLQAFFSHKGMVLVNPIFLPTIVDAPDGDGYFSALKNRYNQCVRHAWGAIDIAYAMDQSKKHPEIPFLTRALRIYKLIKTHIIWSSNWFLLTLGTSLPAILNPKFFNTTLGYNLPRVSNVMLTICLVPLVIIIILDWKLRPKENDKSFGNILKNLLQWPFMPIATLVLSALPGLHSHTRLMIGKRLEYKTTVKKVSN